jgi:RNase P subunit RPR2
VVAWQTAVLAVNAVCQSCNAILPKGSDAAVAITDAPGARPVLCLSCLKELRDEPTDASAE